MSRAEPCHAEIRSCSVFLPNLGTGHKTFPQRERAFDRKSSKSPEMDTEEITIDTGIEIPPHLLSWLNGYERFYLAAFPDSPGVKLGDVTDCPVSTVSGKFYLAFRSVPQDTCLERGRSKIR